MDFIPVVCTRLPHVKCEPYKPYKRCHADPSNFMIDKIDWMCAIQHAEKVFKVTGTEE